MMAKQSYKIPFVDTKLSADTPKRKEFLTYVDRWAEPDAVMIDNFTFYGTLRFIGVERGQSAAHFKVRIEDAARLMGGTTPPGGLFAIQGAIATMFIHSALEVMQQRNVTDGKVTGLWTFIKRGTNYGIAMAEQEP